MTIHGPPARSAQFKVSSPALSSHCIAPGDSLAKFRPIRVDYADHVTVWVDGTNEHMPLADWYARYPDGTLIHWTYGDEAA